MGAVSSISPTVPPMDPALARRQADRATGSGGDVMRWTVEFTRSETCDAEVTADTVREAIETARASLADYEVWHVSGIVTQVTPEP